MQRVDRMIQRLTNQEKARANAAGASAVLRERRLEHQHVATFLVAVDRARVRRRRSSWRPARSG